MGFTQELKNRKDINVSTDDNFQFNDPDLSCHIKWLQISTIKENNEFQERYIEINELLDCSYLHMRMIRNKFPDNQGLAGQAAFLYPNDTAPLYWLIEASDPEITEKSKNIVQRILNINPKDGLAWRYLGIIYIKQGDIPGAIDAHINSCFNGDPGVNGCYNAGRLLEQEGKFEEALYYYRLSSWSVSKENANRLEAELSGN